MSTKHRARRHPRRVAAVGGGAAGILLCAVAGFANASSGSAATSTAKAKPAYNFGSGYSAINGTYTSVSANWIQPTATCRGGNQQTGFWAGLSGSGTRNNKFTLTIKDVTRGWTKTENKTQVSTGGAPTSANVIVEANSGTGGPTGNVTDFGSVTFSGATANGKPLGSWPLWTGNLADMSGVQEDTVSALSEGGRRFTATWLSTG